MREAESARLPLILHPTEHFHKIRALYSVDQRCPKIQFNDGRILESRKGPSGYEEVLPAALIMGRGKYYYGLIETLDKVTD